MRKFLLCAMVAAFALMAAVSSSEALSMQEQTSTNIAFKPFYGSPVGLTFPSNWISCKASVSVTCVWSVVSGSLPPGLYLACSDSKNIYNSSYEHNKGRYCHIAGTPTKAGTYTFTLRVDSNTGDFATNRYTITITGSDSPDPDDNPSSDSTGGSGGVGGGGCNSGFGILMLAVLVLKRSR